MLKAPSLPHFRNGLPSELLRFLDGRPEILSAETARRRITSTLLLNEGQKHIQLLQNHAGQLQQKAEAAERLQQKLLAAEQELQAERQTPIARIFWKRLKKRLKANG